MFFRTRRSSRDSLVALFWTVENVLLLFYVHVLFFAYVFAGSHVYMSSLLASAVPEQDCLYVGHTREGPHLAFVCRTLSVV